MVEGGEKSASGTEIYKASSFVEVRTKAAKCGKSETVEHILGVVEGI